MICISLDSSHWDASDDSLFMSIALIYMLSYYYLKNLKIFADNLLSISAKNKKLLPLDAPQWDESNELKFVLLWLLDGKIFHIIVIFLKNTLWLYNRYITVIYVI